MTCRHPLTTWASRLLSLSKRELRRSLLRKTKEKRSDLSLKHSPKRIQWSSHRPMCQVSLRFKRFRNQRLRSPQPRRTQALEACKLVSSIILRQRKSPLLRFRPSRSLLLRTWLIWKPKRKMSAIKLTKFRQLWMLRLSRNRKTSGWPQSCSKS